MTPLEGGWDEWGTRTKTGHKAVADIALEKYTHTEITSVLYPLLGE